MDFQCPSGTAEMLPKSREGGLLSSVRDFINFFAIWKPVWSGSRIGMVSRVYLLFGASNFIFQFCSQSFERHDFSPKLMSKLEMP